MRNYYAINESTARVANDINSFRDYKAGKATAEYKARVDAVYDIAEKIAQEKPNLAERAAFMADRYSKKLADYYNAYYRNEASCPSVMIAGPANFPTRKKQKQNSRRDSLMAEWNYLESYAQKIENLLTMQQPILSRDENAIELLQDKLETMEREQEMMKQVNAYYRKNKTLDGCPDLTEEEIEKLKANMANSWRYEDKPFMTYELTNNNSSIKRTKARLESLQAVKEEGTKEEENEFFRVVENTEAMRLQLFFDGKPSDEVREAVKKRGFKWAPSQGAWQRQLTENAKYSLKMLIKDLQALA